MVIQRSIFHRIVCNVDGPSVYTDHAAAGKSDSVNHLFRYDEVCSVHIGNYIIINAEISKVVDHDAGNRNFVRRNADAVGITTGRANITGGPGSEEFLNAQQAAIGAFISVGAIAGSIIAGSAILATHVLAFI